MASINEIHDVVVHSLLVMKVSSEMPATVPPSLQSVTACEVFGNIICRRGEESQVLSPTVSGPCPRLTSRDNIFLDGGMGLPGQQQQARSSVLEVATGM